MRARNRYLINFDAILFSHFNTNIHFTVNTYNLISAFKSRVSLISEVQLILMTLIEK